MMFKGDISLIFARPVAVSLLAVAVVFIGYRLVGPLLGKKIELKVEEDHTL